MAAKGAIDKWKSKKWIEIVAPKMFMSKTIGYTIATEPKNVVGRIVKTDLNELMGDSGSRQRIMVKCRIEKLSGDQAITKFLGFAVQQDHRRAVVRKRNSRVYVNQTVRTKDGNEFAVKATILIARGVVKSVRTTIFNRYTNAILAEAENNKFSDFISNLLSGGFSAKMKKELHTIYPIKQVVIEKLEIPETLMLPDEPVARVRQRRERAEGEIEEKDEKTVESAKKEEKSAEKVPEKEEKPEKTAKKDEKPMEKPEKEVKIEAKVE